MMPKYRLFSRYGRCLPIVAAACMALYFSGAAQAVNKSYLDALEAEAQSGAPVAPSGAGQETGMAVPAKKAKTLINKLPEGLSQADMEVLLKDGFYGSYMFYNKLDNTQKETVYKEYQANPSIKGVRDKIMELLKR